VAYDSNQMPSSRRDTLLSLLLSPLLVPAEAQVQTPTDHPPLGKTDDDDVRLPNGKSQRDEIARQQHADALKDVDALVAAAEELRDQLKHAGDFVVPVSSVRKTEEIEKLARKIRGRLKN
jgi:hypothetical protein